MAYFLGGGLLALLSLVLFWGSHQFEASLMRGAAMAYLALLAGMMVLALTS